MFVALHKKTMSKKTGCALTAQTHQKRNENYFPERKNNKTFKNNLISNKKNRSTKTFNITKIPFRYKYYISKYTKSSVTNHNTKQHIQKQDNRHAPTADTIAQEEREDGRGGGRRSVIPYEKARENGTPPTC